MATVLTDDEFLELWNTHKSASKIAKITGINERKVHSRRRTMEQKYNLVLVASDKRTNAFGKTTQPGITWVSKMVRSSSSLTHTSGPASAAPPSRDCCGQSSNSSPRRSSITAMPLMDPRSVDFPAWGGTASPA